MTEQNTDMSRKTKEKQVAIPETPEDEAPPPAAGEAPEEAEAETQEPREDPGEDPAERLVEVEAEAAELRDKLLRALAETENVRRRAQREREDARKYAIAGFAREMLTVTDNLRRAVDSVPAEARGESEAVENLVVGVEMTERAMLGAFERSGIQPIEAMGRKFDHNFHEALFELEDTSVPSGTVLQVMEQGYVLHDRLLRPAKVVVSRGGPKEDPENGDAEPAEAAGDTAAKAYEKPAATGAQVDEEL